MDPQKISEQIITLSVSIRNSGQWIRDTLVHLWPETRSSATEFYTRVWIPFQLRWQRTLKPMISLVKKGDLHVAAAFLKKAAQEWKTLTERYVAILAEHGELESGSRHAMLMEK